MSQRKAGFIQTDKNAKKLKIFSKQTNSADTNSLQESAGNAGGEKKPSLQRLCTAALDVFRICSLLFIAFVCCKQ